MTTGSRAACTLGNKGWRHSGGGHQISRDACTLGNKGWRHSSGGHQESFAPSHVELGNHIGASSFWQWQLMALDVLWLLEEAGRHPSAHASIRGALRFRPLCLSDALLFQTPSLCLSDTLPVWRPPFQTPSLCLSDPSPCAYQLCLSWVPELH